MKKNTLAALILTTTAAGQLASLQAHAAGQLNVWEDIKKSAGIKTAVSDFEKQYNVKVNLQRCPTPSNWKTAPRRPGGHWAGRAGDPE